MEITKALELLKQHLDEIPKLRTLPPDKKHYKLWCAEVCNILELTFGKSSREYDNFTRAVSVDYIVSTDEEKREKYNKELDAYETTLRSAIHKCELLEVEEKPLEAQKPHEERQGKQPLRKEIRKHLQRRPEQLAPHIVRVASEFQFPQGFNCYAEEESNKSSQFSKEFTIYRITGGRLPHVTYMSAKPEELPRIIGTITLQSLSNNRTLLIAKHTLPSFDSEGSYFDSFLTGLSLEFKALSFEKSRVKKIWQWIKSHARLTTLLAVLALIITLLGTNWDIVQENFNKLFP